MKRFRLSTLMLLIVIAALVATVLVQQIQINRYKAQLQACLAEGRVLHAQTQQLIAKRDELLLMNAEIRAALENELGQTKKLLNSAKLDAAKDKR
jgi:ABC-type siderophore export system fused ATPase/permease subunit